MAAWTIPPPGASLHGDLAVPGMASRKRSKRWKKNGNGSARSMEAQPSKFSRKTLKTGQPLRVTRPKYRVRGPSWEDPDVPDNALPDGQIADKAIETLRHLKGKTFFLGVGFHKPHLPFVAPEKYFDLYPPNEIHPPDNPYPPKNAPDIAMHNWGELRNYADMPKKGPLSEKQTLELIRAYYAAASYTDAQIGRLTDELDRLGLRENTIVILWGDHGWQLGEHALWCKHTNFELATHAPLIISAPGQENAGVGTDGLCEFVDIYPTLCDLCSLPQTGWPGRRQSRSAHEKS